MQKHIHGGNIYKASEKYGINADDILDFSANINPLGLPEALKKTLVSSINSLVNYPDPECKQLVKNISQYLSVLEDNVIVGNGASEIIFLLFEVLRPGKVFMPAPTFAEYAKAAVKFGADISYFELKEQNDFKLDIDRFIKQIEDEVDCVFLCNPNNPTSTLVDTGDLLKLLKHCRTRNILMVIDEAFIELTVGGNSNSMTGFLKEYDNLFVIRAFTKVFAVPGLRLGYGLGSTDIVKKMWDHKLPWSVNSLACSIGNILSDDLCYLRKTGDWIAKEKEYFYGRLREFSCLKVFEPQTNFALIKILLDGLTSAKLGDMMAAKGILIRDASNFTFLDDKYFRVAIKDRKSNEKFLVILDEVLKSCKG